MHSLSMKKIKQVQKENYQGKNILFPTKLLLSSNIIRKKYQSCGRKERQTCGIFLLMMKESKKKNLVLD